MQMFEDSGRLHAHHNRIKRGLPPGQSLSRELERDCCQQELSREFRYSWLGLFNCWIGHNYPVLSSPPHALRSGAHWPNRMEYFTPFPLETNLHRLFDKQSVPQCCSFFFLWTMIQYYSQGHFIFETAPQHFILRRLCNISSWDGSALVYRHIWSQLDTCYYRQHLYGQTCKNNVIPYQWLNPLEPKRP